MYACWIGGAVLAAVLSVSLPHLFDLLAILWVAASVIGVNWLCRFRCPRCNLPFFVRGPTGGLSGNYSNLYTDKCLNCDLPKWQP